MLTRLLALALGLAACRTDRRGDTPARDLSRLLASPPASDSLATSPAESAFAACAFVYSTEEKLRECLVITYGWPPQEADRAITVYVAQLQRARDSILDAAIARTESSRVARANWWRRNGGAPWVGSRANQHYYKVSLDCWTGRQLPKSDRVYFQSEAAAQAAGYFGVAETGCY